MPHEELCSADMQCSIEASCIIREAGGSIWFVHAGAQQYASRADPALLVDRMNSSGQAAASAAALGAWHPCKEGLPFNDSCSSDSVDA